MPDSAPLPTARKANAVEPNVTARDVTTGSFPSSRKIHVAGRRHSDIRVAMREIDLEPSANEPALRGYDTAGPYSDPAAATDIHVGSPASGRSVSVACG